MLNTTILDKVSLPFNFYSSLVGWFIIHSSDKPNCFTNALIVIYVSVFCFCLSFRYIPLIFYRIIRGITNVDCITNGVVRGKIKQDRCQLDDFKSIRWTYNQHQKSPKKNFPYYLPRYRNRQKRRHIQSKERTENIVLWTGRSFNRDISKTLIRRLLANQPYDHNCIWDW